MYSVEKIEDQSGLKRFIKFPFSLFRDDPNWVPPLISDELTVFNPKKNPAFDHCEASYWMVTKDGVDAGRIAAIVHEQEAKDEKALRFGWIDFIDDPEVSRLLLEAAETWGRERGLTTMQGPLGFTDMDFEGMLVEGFEYPATIATIYNYPYYPEHLEQLGYEKAIDWVELRSEVPEESPRRLVRRAQMVESRFKFKSVRLHSKKEAQKYGEELFDVLNRSYENLYGFHELSPKQIQFYIGQYLGFVVPELLSLVVNEEDKLIGFAITMPSLTSAFQKAKGKLFPFGFLHILKAIRKNDIADMYLIGVLPEYQKFGVTALIFRDLVQAYIDRGIKVALTNQMLETNYNVLQQFNEFQESSEIYKRRRCFKKDIA
ncbi:MAG: hypothetical protein AAGA85_11635 [Bacteroidota bacterium]